MLPTCSLSTIQRKFDSYQQLIKNWDFQIALTDEDKDFNYLESLETINENNINGLKILNNQDVAFAVALVLKIIVEQPIDFFEYIGKQLYEIESCCSKQATCQQKYALDLLKFIIYQLDKREPLVYLDQFLKNKNIPIFFPEYQPQGLSKIYSFVQRCDLAQLFKPLKKHFRIQIWKEDFNGESFDFNFYQPNSTFPILVLMKENLEQLQQKVYDHHQIFIKNVSLQVILDATNKQLSQTTENLKAQPFRFESIEELAALLCQGQSNFLDKVAKIKKIPKIKQTLSFLIQPGVAFSYYLQKIKADYQEQVDVFVTTESDNNDLFSPSLKYMNLRFQERYYTRLCNVPLDEFF